MRKKIMACVVGCSIASESLATNDHTNYTEKFRKEAPNIIGGWEHPVSDDTKELQKKLTGILQQYKNGKKQCIFKVSVDKKGKLSVNNVSAESRRSSCNTPFTALQTMDNIKLAKPPTFLKNTSIILAEEANNSERSINPKGLSENSYESEMQKALDKIFTEVFPESEPNDLNLQLYKKFKTIEYQRNENSERECRFKVTIYPKGSLEFNQVELNNRKCTIPMRELSKLNFSDIAGIPTEGIRATILVSEGK